MGERYIPEVERDQSRTVAHEIVELIVERNMSYVTGSYALALATEDLGSVRFTSSLGQVTKEKGWEEKQLAKIADFGFSICKLEMAAVKWKRIYFITITVVGLSLTIALVALLLR